MTKPLETKLLLAYGLPSLGLAAMNWWIVLALLSYSDRVLGFGPAAVGAVFALGRVWDAVSDPWVGWGSDRTRNRFGRRRPWMAWGAVPAALAFVALWSAPTAADGDSPYWIMLALLAFYSASTMVAVPHASLGAELSPDSHQRTRLFAVRGALEFVGMLLGVAALGWLEQATDQRLAATQAACVLGLVLVTTTWVSVGILEEPKEHRDRFHASPYRAFRDVWRNEHARTLLLVFFLSELAISSLAAALPYATAVFGGADQGSALTLLVFIVPIALSIPLWVRGAKRFGKRRVWLFASAMSTVGFLGLFLVGPESAALLAVLGFVVGVGQGAVRVLPHAVKADVIDIDEQRTGERKEGTYFAAWNLAQKAAAGGSIAVTGMLIQVAGISDGEIANPWAVRMVVAGWPALLLAFATLGLTRLRVGDGGSQREPQAPAVALKPRSFSALG